MGVVEHQRGSMDCGVYATAVATSLAFGHLGPFNFHHRSMRQHLVDCLEKIELTPFLQY